VTEIELKLAARPDDLAKLKASLLAMSGKPAATSGLTSTYYDTADRSLRRQDLSLRVRKQGRRFVQTVKAYDVDGPDLAARRVTQVSIEHADRKAVKAGVARLRHDEIPDSVRGMLRQPLRNRLAERVALVMHRGRKHLHADGRLGR